MHKINPQASGPRRLCSREDAEDHRRTRVELFGALRRVEVAPDDHRRVDRGEVKGRVACKVPRSLRVHMRIDVDIDICTDGAVPVY